MKAFLSALLVGDGVKKAGGASGESLLWPCLTFVVAKKDVVVAKKRVTDMQRGVFVAKKDFSGPPRVRH